MTSPKYVYRLLADGEPKPERREPARTRRFGIAGLAPAEQAAFLRTHGCNEAQGYYFARPVPASEMRALLERGTLPVT